MNTTQLEDFDIWKDSPYWKRYYERNKSRVHARTRVYQRDKIRALRVKVLDAYGCRCARCGFSGIRALQIDHVNGDGAEMRKRITSNLYQLKYVLDHPSEFQILCANCNWIKRAENGETPWQKVKAAAARNSPHDGGSG